jgi:hypothetical protein
MTHSVIDQLFAQPPPAPGPEPGGGGAGVSVDAGLTIQLGRVADVLESQARRRQQLMQQLHQVPILGPQVPLAGGAGTLDVPDVFSAKTGYCWSIRRLALTGFSAGTVTVYKNFAGGEVLVPFPAAGVSTFGRAEALLMPGERLVFVAAGVTGFVQVGGAADCFESWLLPDYLM